MGGAQPRQAALPEHHLGKGGDVPEESTPHGYCQCGCGERTTINEKDNRRYGWVKGEPKRFRKGHWKRTVGLTPWSPNLWRIEDRGYLTPCWIWLGAKDPLGYGRFRNRTIAYRFSYEQVKGSIPDGLELDHLCRVPSCVNPDHLEPVTHHENLLRGRGTKMTMTLADQIRSLYEPRRVTYSDLADRYGVCTRTIYLIVKRKRWTH